jgi:hypothetical protein
MTVFRAARFVALSAAICLALAACASKPVPPPEPSKPPDWADGLYRGTSTRFQAESRACPHPGLVKLDVFKGRFQFRWDRNTYIDATLAPDGSVQGNLGDFTLAGKLIDRRIEGDVTNGECGLHFTAKQQPPRKG